MRSPNSPTAPRWCGSPSRTSTTPTPACSKASVPDLLHRRDARGAGPQPSRRRAGPRARRGRPGRPPQLEGSAALVAAALIAVARRSSGPGAAQRGYPGAKLLEVTMPRMEISATMLRQRVARGEPIDPYVRRLSRSISPAADSITARELAAPGRLAPVRSTGASGRESRPRPSQSAPGPSRPCPRPLCRCAPTASCPRTSPGSAPLWTYQPQALLSS